MLIYQALITAILALLFLNTANNLRLLRRPEVSLRSEGRALVSLLVPARNEARSIAQCVESLAHQDYPWCEILVLDDQSEDQTAAIVERLAERYPNIRLLRGQPLPPHWHGKAYACAQLAQASRGEWLLFVDADTTLAPQCVSSALRQAQEQHADLLTMMPSVLTGSFGEALLLPIIPLTFGAFLPLGLVTNHPSPLFAGALGTFLLFRRDTYLRMGGHSAVRTEIVEDIALSRVVKQHGGRVVWIDGTALMRVRLYHGFREAAHGIAKSAFAAINYSLVALVLAAPVCIALFGGPYVFFAVGLISATISSPMFWLPLLQIVFLWTAHLLLMRRFHLPTALMFLQVGTILAIVITTIYSAAKTTFGQGVAWKGRTYQFATLHQRNEPRNVWATGLVIARSLIAALLLGSVWFSGRAHPAASLLLLGWTVALLENLARRGAESRGAMFADVTGGIACLGYLQLSGLLPFPLVVAVVLFVAICARWFTWQIVATMASILPGIILFITAERYAPNTILLGWFVLIALVASRSVAHVVIPWLQRFRSS
jgi:chlorobactene glucosyltransferase